MNMAIKFFRALISSRLLDCLKVGGNTFFKFLLCILLCDCTFENDLQPENLICQCIRHIPIFR